GRASRGLKGIDRTPHGIRTAAAQASTDSGFDGKKTPLPGHAVEVVRATAYEAQAGAGHQVLHRAGDEDLARCAARRHPGADVAADASHVFAHQLALTRVQPGPDLDPERADAVADGARAADGSRRSVEGRKEAIADRLHLAPAEPHEFAADEGVVAG